MDEKGSDWGNGKGFGIERKLERMRSVKERGMLFCLFWGECWVGLLEEVIKEWGEGGGGGVGRGLMIRNQIN
jgi:hypothetical protein